MTARSWRWTRLIAGPALIAVILWRLGTGPFARGWHAVTPGAIVAAAALTAVTTVCAAWRWRIVARGLGLNLALGPAIAACYRAQFLNSILPVGIAGDVHRGAVHGRDAGTIGGGLRAVLWERAAGQVVQLALTVVALAALPSPFQLTARVVLAVGAATALTAWLILGLRRGSPNRASHAASPEPTRAAHPVQTGRGRLIRTWHLALTDIRTGVLAPDTRTTILVTSMAVAVCQAGVFVVAIRATGVTADLVHVIPVALLVQAAAALPLSVAGWGPREGVAAAAFALVGWGAPLGVEAGTILGIIALVAVLPGAVVLAWGAARVAPGPRAALERVDG